MAANGFKTYCNPLSIPQIPKGEDDGWAAMEYTGEPQADYRSISDPSVMWYDGKWYLYPSYGMAYVSEDFVTWKHVRMEPYNLKYSPSVVPWKGKFLLTGHSNGLYIGDNPLGPFEFLGDFILPDGQRFRPVDPALFTDEDGRVYLYYFFTRPTGDKYTFISQTLGVELDDGDPRIFAHEPKVLCEFNEKNEWERFGEHNEDTRFGWLEGQWMYKHGGRYYLICSSAGTQFSNYCMCAYFSDEGPLGPFVPQKHNPITQQRHGLARGAGHGCVVDGPNDTIWAFYTSTLCYTHLFERRIGMDLMGINEDSELYCPEVTQTPQYGPGVMAEPLSGNSAGLLPLTFRRRGSIRASSYVEGRNALYAFDDSMLTWWQPAEGDADRWIDVDLEAPYVVEATRVIWRDVGMDYEKGALPGAYQYVVEGKTPDDGKWVKILDMSDNDEDYNIEYRSFPPVCLTKIRLRIVGAPEKITPGVISFTAFGTRK